MTVSISDAFDGGNIEHVETTTSKDGDEITVKLRIKPDPFTELENTAHFQYFSFLSSISSPSLSSSSDEQHNNSTVVTYKVINAGDASYAVAWNGATTFYSKDRVTWKRVRNTNFDKETGHLSWTFPHQSSNNERVHFCYFPPYSHERHLSLISQCHSHENAKVEVLGQSLDGRDMECVTVGSGDKKVWIIHRQHPGETMAEYYAEGLLERLLGLNSNSTNHCIDGMAANALQRFTFYIVPNMCPDGSVRGHLRTNAIGTNLNREWAPSTNTADNTHYDAPTLHRSPEVYCVLNAMDKTGVDAFLDVHGDEELPYNFVAGAEGLTNWGDRLKHLQGAFLQSYARANSDMQVEVGYEPEAPNEGRLNVCSNQIAHRFDCLGVTLEMPFKDCRSNPNPDSGWSPQRAKLLGKSVLDALMYVEPYLRDETEFWKVNVDRWEKEDRYVCPTSKYE